MSANAAPPIEADGLTKVYRDRDWLGRRSKKTGLQSLDLALRPGEAFGLIGPNGAGKSTTLKGLMGLIFPTEGEIRLNGVPANRSESRRGVGFIPESPSLYHHLTAFETVYGAARMQGLNREEARADARQQLESVGLSGEAATPLRRFSRGMVQRVAIAHALAGRPELVVADEPLTTLDPIWRREVVELLIAFRDRGGTILLSSHILADVERLADRVGILFEGALREISTPARLIADNVTRYRVRTHGEDPPDEGGAEREAEDQWALETEGDKLQATLSRLQSQGHRIIEVRPAGAGLEEALAARLESYREGDGAGAKANHLASPTSGASP